MFLLFLLVITGVETSVIVQVLLRNIWRLVSHYNYNDNLFKYGDDNQNPQVLEIFTNNEGKILQHANKCMAHYDSTLRDNSALMKTDTLAKIEMCSDNSTLEIKCGMDSSDEFYGINSLIIITVISTVTSGIIASLVDVWIILNRTTKSQRDKITESTINLISKTIESTKK